MAKKPKSKAKPKKTGRPPKKFAAEEMRQIERMALDNCHLDTIGMALGIPKTTLVQRLSTVITQKRAEGRTQLRRTQRKLAAKNPAMAIFLGKNELDQTDKHEQIHGVTDALSELLKEIGGSGLGIPITKEKPE